MFLFAAKRNINTLSSSVSIHSISLMLSHRACVIQETSLWQATPLQLNPLTSKSTLRLSTSTKPTILCPKSFNSTCANLHQTTFKKSKQVYSGFRPSNLSVATPTTRNFRTKPALIRQQPKINDRTTPKPSLRRTPRPRDRRISNNSRKIFKLLKPSRNLKINRPNQGIAATSVVWFFCLRAPLVATSRGTTRTKTLTTLKS